MRPDEHKRKKNALYKKKHGIPPKGKDETKQKPPGQKKSQKEKPKTETREHGQRQQPTTSLSASSIQPNEDSSSSSGSDEEDTSRSQKATFRRREIISNWARYEEVPDDGTATPTQRGEDFNKLLNLSGKTGSSLSQFRFRDEEDWGDGMTQIGTGQVLAVDTEDLATVLDCVPIHRLLSLDPKLFSTNQIKEQVEEAKLNEEMYLQKRATRQKTTLIELEQQKLDIVSVSMPSDDANIDQTTVTITQSSLLDVSLQKDKKSSSQKCNGYHRVQRDNNNKTVVKVEEKLEKSPLESPKVNDKFVDKIQPNMKVEDVTESKTKSDEEDLDFILSLDKPVYAASIQNIDNDVSTDNSDNDNERTKSEPSSLLQETLERTEMKTDLNKGSTQTKKDNGTTQEDTTEDLEDWLDSMLDN